MSWKKVEPQKFYLDGQPQSDSPIQALVTLRDDADGIAHIYEDDGCYILAFGFLDIFPRRHTYWFAEAVKALKELPDLPIKEVVEPQTLQAEDSFTT